MALDLMNKTYELLSSKPNEQFTTRDIANWIFANYNEDCLEKIVRTSINSEQELISQLSSEISAHKRNLIKKYLKISSINTRPMKFFYIENEDFNKKEISIESENSKKHKVAEKDMYSVLSRYLLTELNVYSKRIDEKCSTNSKGQNEIKDFVKVYPENRIKLWSFEFKLSLNRSNLREYFFQVVSNSLWVNLAYLVPAEIIGIDTIKELRILSAAHGIGVISLNLEKIELSEIIIPAREKNSLEWDIMNRLVSEDKNFKNYIEHIKEFCQIGKIKPSDWNYQLLEVSL